MSGTATSKNGLTPRRAQRHVARVLHRHRRAEHRARPLRPTTSRASRHPHRAPNRLLVSRNRTATWRRDRHDHRRPARPPTRRCHQPPAHDDTGRVRRTKTRRAHSRPHQPSPHRLGDGSARAARARARARVRRRLVRPTAVTPNIYAEIEGHEAILALVALGCGVGIVPKLVLERARSTTASPNSLPSLLSTVPHRALRPRTIAREPHHPRPLECLARDARGARLSVALRVAWISRPLGAHSLAWDCWTADGARIRTSTRLGAVGVSGWTPRLAATSDVHSSFLRWCSSGSSSSTQSRRSALRSTTMVSPSSMSAFGRPGMPRVPRDRSRARPAARIGRLRHKRDGDAVPSAQCVIREVGSSISGIPGAPRGPAYRTTAMSLSLNVWGCVSSRSMSSLSPLKTWARPVNTPSVMPRSTPATLRIAPPPGATQRELSVVSSLTGSQDSVAWTVVRRRSQQESRTGAGGLRAQAVGPSVGQVAACTAQSVQDPGMPLSWCSPRLSNVMPEPATRSTTVRDTSTSPASASACTREAV